jgi:hypothetical protein
MTKGHVITKLLQRQFFACIILCIFVFSTFAVHVSANSVQQIVISEIKLGGPTEGQLTEFIELFNDSGNVIDLTGYSLEYAKSAAILVQPECRSGVWEGSDVRVNNLSGLIQPRGRAVFQILLNDNVDGSVRLRDANADVLDLVGWGVDSKCYEAGPAARPPNRSSIKRLFDTDGHPINTLNNYSDFVVSQSPLPEVDYPPESQDSENPEDPSPEPAVVLCQNQVIISEFLPDPSGLESAGGEFIELYNPSSDEASLLGCSLKSSKSKVDVVNFTETDRISPGGYYVVRLTDKLTNASGVITFATSEREDVVEYAGMKEGQVYALLDGSWRIMALGTPGEVNEVAAISEQIVGGSGSGSILADCGEGRYRHPETNRCRNIESQSSALTPCAADQERNPETNRCRKITLSSAALTPCAADQFRNPETNRCKKIASGESNLKPCEAGQERNAETNRCRKIASVVSGTPLESTAQPAAIGGAFKYKTPIIGLLAVFFGGYALYEYRTDIKNYTSQFREKRRGRPPG